jgi:hypothetical protein
MIVPLATKLLLLSLLLLLAPLEQAAGLPARAATTPMRLLTSVSSPVLRFRRTHGSFGR